MIRTLTWSGVAAVSVLALGLSLAPRQAAAQEFRVGVLAGAGRLETRTPQGPSLTATLRLEASVGALAWFHLGAYVDSMADLSAGNTPLSYGGILSFRPRLPFSPVHPMAFASVGYLNYPVGGHAVSSGWDGQLGLGVVINANSFIDIEARGAVIQMFTRDDNALNATGFVFSGGVAFHL